MSKPQPVRSLSEMSSTEQQELMKQYRLRLANVAHYRDQARKTAGLKSNDVIVNIVKIGDKIEEMLDKLDAYISAGIALGMFTENKSEV